MRTGINFQETVINVAEAQKFVYDDTCGAVACFTGVTRQDTNVTGLFFETHESLARAVMDDIVTQVRTQIPNLQHVYVQHRLGFVPVGQDNVVIAVSSPHRKDAFRALETLMNELKARLPVWKKEMYADGSSKWLENVEFTCG
jgi:molybdopterin synthase catalytic subunit